MSRKNKLPLLSEILKEVDADQDLADHQNSHHHQVSYGHSRTIISYIEKDVQLTAYAHNPGNSVVIFAKKNGLIAYGCYLDSFPAGNGYPSYHWTKMKVDEAIAKIRQDNWSKAGYLEGVDYKDTENHKWQELAFGEIEYISSFRSSDLTIDRFRSENSQYIYTMDYTVLRLSSGKLRIEVDGKYYAYDQFLEILLFFQADRSSNEISMDQLPNYTTWQRVVSIDTLDDELMSELKAQTVARKMKQAA